MAEHMRVGGLVVCGTGVRVCVGEERGMLTIDDFDCRTKSNTLRKLKCIRMQLKWSVLLSGNRKMNGQKKGTETHKNRDRSRVHLLLRCFVCLCGLWSSRALTRLSLWKYFHDRSMDIINNGCVATLLSTSYAPLMISIIWRCFFFARTFREWCGDFPLPQTNQKLIQPNSMGNIGKN